MAGAYIRQLLDLDGGYGGVSASHSDVHLWYHGTVDLSTPADDTVATIGHSERRDWWTRNEDSGATAGFYLSLLGGGDRLATNQPAGPGTSRVKSGYNQKWDLGAGLGANRTALPANSGDWPNLIKFNLAGTNLMAQGQSNSVTLYYQWAKPAASTATVSIYLDDDFNPWNGNEQLVQQMNVAGTTSSNVGFAGVDIHVAAANSTPGIHAVFAQITHDEHTRYLYAPELLTVFSSFQPPTLELVRASASQMRLDVNGLPGQRVVLQTTADLMTWKSIATNWLTTTRWSIVPDPQNEGRQFFRAALW